MGLCFPGSSDPSAVIRGPGEVTGPEQGWLTVQCHYEPRWESYVKYWCQGAEFISCKFLVKTTGSNWEVKRDRVSIRDNQTSHTFTVTMEKLRRGDAGTYWCGIERTGTDHGVRVKVTIGPGKNMCMYDCVTSGTALSWPLRSLSRDCAHSEETVTEGG